MGGDTRVYSDFVSVFPQKIFSLFVDFRTDRHKIVRLHDIDPSGNRRRGNFMIAGYHDNLHTGALCVLDGVNRALTRRIDYALKSEKFEPRSRFFLQIDVFAVASQFLQPESKNPQPLLKQAVGLRV